jgi:FtsP/CotA-like multicopper oxidase with cupredoxin domain
MVTRRFFLASGASLGAVSFARAMPAAWQSAAPDASLAQAVRLKAITRTFEVNGRAAMAMGLESPGGKAGLSFSASRAFNVVLENKMSVPTAIHWHGLHPPNDQDGVPGLTQAVVTPRSSVHYAFPVRPSGTHWMHSHQGLQEAFLLSAPLIVHDPTDEAVDEQQVIVFLGDFSFTPPKEIYSRLRRPSGMDRKAMSLMKKMTGKPDANDVDYDAYLTNDRTLDDPQVERVEKGGRIRLRVINGSSGTNFFVDLGELTADLIATDGMPVKPLRGARFPLAIAQRIDLRLQLPSEGAFPILALRENAREQTGIILATANAAVPKLPVTRDLPAPLLGLELERSLAAVHPLAPRPIDRSFDLRLTGDMSRYAWGINGVVFDVEQPRNGAPLVQVKRGQRIGLRFVNETGMAHPMHLHGHSFQVIDINGQVLDGAVRDTVLVPPRTSVTVAFDCDNPGTWYLHCHVLWHLAAGMAALVQYS